APWPGQRDRPRGRTAVPGKAGPRGRSSAECRRTERPRYSPAMAEAPRLAMSRLEAVRLLRRDPIGLLERAADLGDVVRVRVPRLDLFVINHPDLVWDVLATDSRAFSKGPTMQAAKRVLGESLLTSEGEYHRRQRRLIQPLFRNERIVGFA